MSDIALDPRICAANGCDERFNPKGSRRYCSSTCLRRETTRRELERRRAKRPAKPAQKLTCPTCGTAFEATNAKRRFCKPACAKSWANRQMVERRSAQNSLNRESPTPERKPKPPKNRPLLACPSCGESFQRGHPQQRFCGRTCRVKAGRKRQWEREKAALRSTHLLAAHYPLGENDLHGPVCDLATFRERFSWPYSMSSRRNIARRAAELLGTDLESVERAIARLRADDYAAANYIRHELAEVLLIASRGDFWGLPALPLKGSTAREMAETWADLHEPELSENERIDLAHVIARFAHGYLNADATLSELEQEALSNAA